MYVVELKLNSQGEFWHEKLSEILINYPRRNQPNHGLEILYTR